jgi:hypothetical protein
MKTYTNDEIKAMVGTEFIYVFASGAYIPAVIVAYDPEIGFTCLATKLVSSTGYDMSDQVDENGNLCLVGFDIIDMEIFSDRLMNIIFMIKNLGYYRVGFTGSLGLNKRTGVDSPICAFQQGDPNA